MAEELVELLVEAVVAFGRLCWVRLMSVAGRTSASVQAMSV